MSGDNMEITIESLRVAPSIIETTSSSLSKEDIFNKSD